MMPCTVPAIPAAGTLEERYVHGVDCTWHGSVLAADRRGDGQPCCPHCGGELGEFPTEAQFWALMHRQESKLPGYTAMLRWSAALCFPDFETLQNSYRQHMGGNS